MKNAPLIDLRESHAGDLLRQSGVIPYRVRRGRVEVALVTASSGPHWTVPKGHVEPDLSPADSAAKEAFEEAGLLGEVGTRCIGRYVYQKRGMSRVVELFPLLVERELKRWPEMDERRRRWMTVDEAASHVRSAELRCCLQAFERAIMRRTLRTAAA